MVSASSKGVLEGKEEKKARGSHPTHSLSASNGHLSASTSALSNAAGMDTGDEQEKEGNFFSSRIIVYYLNINIELYTNSYPVCLSDMNFPAIITVTFKRTWYFLVL